jgi:hypothetical protein
MRQGQYWLGTLSYTHAQEHHWTPEKFFTENSDKVAWYKGQEEITENAYHHYQFIFGLKTKSRENAVKRMFLPCHPHIELTRSIAADNYVWKDDTAVLNTRVEYGMQYIYY